MNRTGLFALSFGLACALSYSSSAQDQGAAGSTSADSAALPAVSLGGFAPAGGQVVTGVSKIGEEYAKSAQHIEAGRQLFQAMNCSGCHSNGGGGMGPPLMKKNWIYGGSVENIASTIVGGRPNGMPTFRGLLPMEQVWEIAAFVKYMADHPTEK